MAKHLTMTLTMSLSVQLETEHHPSAILLNIVFLLIYYRRYPLQDPGQRVAGGHRFDTKWAFLDPAFCSSHLPTCPMLAKSIASEKSSLHSLLSRWDWSLQQLQGMKKKGRSRRKRTHLKRTCPIFCPSQHLQGACKDTVFTTRIPSAAACMDTHCSLALLEATLSENLYPNTSRDPAVLFTTVL